jgi:uncharacterized protein (UPF0276 family)
VHGHLNLDIPPRLAVLAPQAVGIGLRSAHHHAFLAQPEAIDFVEVHAENFMAAGGAARAMLKEVRRARPLSLHAVSLGLGSALGVDTEHLGKLVSMVQEFEPALVSDHACFCRAQVPDKPLAVHGADLLPLAFTDASLDILASNVNRVQEALQRPMLVENLSAYLQFEDSTWAEVDFLAELCRRTGCGLLLDVNNLVVNVLNANHVERDARGDDTLLAQAACRWLDALAGHRHVHVGEIHLAGHRAPQALGDLVVDDHSQPVNDSVWQVHDHVMGLWPHAPRLVEWDVDIPPFGTLLNQVAQARQRTAAKVNGHA